jgi:hypothetical protein
LVRCRAEQTSATAKIANCGRIRACPDGIDAEISQTVAITTKCVCAWPNTKINWCKIPQELKQRLTFAVSDIFHFCLLGMFPYIPSCFPMNDNDDDLQLKPSVSGEYLLIECSARTDDTFSQ